MKTKKYINIILSIVLMAAILCGCNQSEINNIKNIETDQSVTDNSNIHIITTIFPEYDWVMNILGDNPAGADITLLLDNGVDLHSYQPTADDIFNISTCDMFIYVGGESDKWVENVLATTQNKDLIAVNLLDILGDKVKEEELIEGMEGEEESEESEEEIEYDEHVWLSLKNSSILVNAIAEEIKKIDPTNANIYSENADAYISKLNTLDAKYRIVTKDSARNTLLFGDRFPFRYMTDDYDLSYYAAFVGCSAETEASFETVTFLSQKIDELDLPAVMTIEGTDHKIAETIIQNTETKDQKILTLDSMQSTTSTDIAAGATYLSIMEKNLDVLKEALK